MGIFRRGRNTEPTVDEETTQQAETGQGAVEDTATNDDSADPQAAEDTPVAGDNAQDTGAAGDAAAERAEQGPFDASEVDAESDDRLDLGALRIRGVPGMELRLELDENAGQVVGATAVMGDSAVQLQAFAAPRSMGIWDGIRSEITQSVLSQGGTAEEVEGPFGTELRTRMPSAGPDGRTVFAPARFAGVDGPRWFLRAVFSGRAAIDDEAAAPLLDVVRNTVVVRGDAAMAPREMLPLRLPDQAAGQEGDDPAEEGGGSDDLKPFERGPEITEVR